MISDACVMLSKEVLLWKQKMENMNNERTSSLNDVQNLKIARSRSFQKNESWTVLSFTALLLRQNLLAKEFVDFLLHFYVNV